MKLKNEQGKKTKFGEPVQVGEEFWAFRKLCGISFNFLVQKVIPEAFNRTDGRWLVVKKLSLTNVQSKPTHPK